MDARKFLAVWTILMALSIIAAPFIAAAIKAGIVAVVR
jgi:hypothetical protein